MKKLFTFVATRQDVVLKTYFAFIILLFLAILVAAYVIAKRANPILLDEKGKPINALECGGSTPLCMKASSIPCTLEENVYVQL